MEANGQAVASHGRPWPAKSGHVRPGRLRIGEPLGPGGILYLQYMHRMPGIDPEGAIVALRGDSKPAVGHPPRAGSESLL